MTGLIILECYFLLKYREFQFAENEAFLQAVYSPQTNYLLRRGRFLLSDPIAPGGLKRGRQPNELLLAPT